MSSKHKINIKHTFIAFLNTNNKEQDHEYNAIIKIGMMPSHPKQALREALVEI